MVQKTGAVGVLVAASTVPGDVSFKTDIVTRSEAALFRLRYNPVISSSSVTLTQTSGAAVQKVTKISGSAEYTQFQINTTGVYSMVADFFIQRPTSGSPELSSVGTLVTTYRIRDSKTTVLSEDTYNVNGAKAKASGRNGSP